MNVARLPVLFIAAGITLVSVIGSFAANAESVEYATEDHLVPRKPEIDGALRPILEKKLFLTAADCALLLIRPAGRAEAAVAVYSEKHKDAAPTFATTLTEANKSIDVTMATEPGRVEELAKITVKRWDAPLPTSTALAIKSAWRAMLDRTKEPEAYARPALHREEFEFSTLVPGAKSLYGTLPNKGGKNVAAFVKLSRLLVRYCKAPSGKRSSIANQIERDAKRLVESIGNANKG